MRIITNPALTIYSPKTIHYEKVFWFNLFRQKFFQTIYLSSRPNIMASYILLRLNIYNRLILCCYRSELWAIYYLLHLSLVAICVVCYRLTFAPMVFTVSLFILYLPKLLNIKLVGKIRKLADVQHPKKRMVLAGLFKRLGYFFLTHQIPAVIKENVKIGSQHFIHQGQFKIEKYPASSEGPVIRNKNKDLFLREHLFTNQGNLVSEDNLLFSTTNLAEGSEKHLVLEQVFKGATNLFNGDANIKIFKSNFKAAGF